ncbi:MAG TPA: SRPBCC domain-containing protein [Candidatus Eremiobacteraceae bacterium]|nr:SRPBCC domain-containing protein [Candidatus Eremiobacteraceae bacterium]
MIFDRTFHVAAPAGAVWDIIKDVPRVLPHIPGARLLESMSNGAHSARITMHAGPMQGTYDVAIAVQSVDDQARSAVVRITADDTTGRGGVNAVVTAGVQPAPGGSRIDIHADIEGSGAAAAAALDQHLTQGATPGAADEFVANLERTLRGGRPFG